MTNIDLTDTANFRSRLELTFELELFYCEEAGLIETGDYKRWIELLAEDIVYSMPQAEFVDRSVNHELDPIGAHSFDGEGKLWILERVAWLTGGPTPLVPMPLRRMLVTNVRVQAERDDGVAVESKFLLWETRSSGHSATFVGRRQDVLRRFEAGWQIARREVTLDSTILPRSLTNLF